MGMAVTVQDDPLALKASFRSWAVELAQSSLESVYTMLHFPVQLTWDQTDLYSADEMLQIKATFDENLALRGVETIPNSEQKTPSQHCAHLHLPAGNLVQIAGA